MSGDNSFEFPQIDSLLPVALGEPGSRVFHIQAVAGSRVVSIKLEKQQVEVLSNHLEHLLEQYSVSEEPPHIDTGIHEPVLAEWVAGSLALAISEEPSRVIVIIEQLFDQEANPDVGPENTAQFGLSASQARAFVTAAHELIEGSRPLCRLCGMPKDPQGHICPRLN